jgi:hypothetical protein
MTRLRVVLAATVLLSCIVSNSMGRPVLEPRDSIQQTSQQQLNSRKLLFDLQTAAAHMQQQRTLLAGAGSQTGTAGPSTAAAEHKQLSWQLQQNTQSEDAEGIHDVVLRPGQLSKVYAASHVHPTRKVLSSQNAQKAQATQGCTGRFC